MKKIGALSLFLALIFFGQTAKAVPVDLSGFNIEYPFVAGSGGISVIGGTVTFNESFDYAPLYFYNDNFLVGSNDTVFSFDYSFQLGANDFDDYFQFELNYNNDPGTLRVLSSGSGHFEIDLTPYRDTQVSLAWGLYWDFDDAAGTVATISNIDLASATTPVPEPSTMILLGSGLVGLIGIGRRKIKKG